MSDTRSVLGACAVQAVANVDRSARAHDLAHEPVPLTTRLGELGIGPVLCTKVTDRLNRYRHARGRPLVADDKITPASTIQDVIDLTCETAA